MGNVLLPENLKQKQFLFGDVSIKAASGDKMQMSGYVSTVTADLSDDIIEPSAWTKHLQRYKNNPIYCWNHDQSMPIGRVEEVEVTPKGLYLRNITLTPDIAINKDFLWPHIKAGVLSQQSVGFLPLAGRPEGEYFKYTECYLLESSLVSVACNPDAVIDVIKSLDGLPMREEFSHVQTLNDLILAHQRGEFLLPSEMRSQFAVGGIATKQHDNGEPKVSTLAPDFTDITLVQLSDKQKALYSPNDEPVDALPKRNIQKNYEELAQLVYLAKSKVRDAYMFRVGSLTKNNGYQYDWTNVAISLCSILGAKGLGHFAREEKLALYGRLFEIYGQLGKAVPTYDSVGLDDLTEDVLADLKFHEVVFTEGEDNLVKQNILETNARAVVDTLKSFGTSRPEYAAEIVKGMYPYMAVSLEAYSPDPDEIDLICFIMSTIQAFVQAEADADGYNSAYDIATYGAPTTALRRFGGFLAAKYAEDAEAEANLDVPAVEEEIVSNEQLEELKSFFQKKYR